MRDHPRQAEMALGRRRLMLGSAGALAGAALAEAAVAPPIVAASGAPLPAPKPIPGGFQIPNGPFLHVFAPGPVGVVLPFTGVPLEGLNVEPNTITDFNGAVAVAFHVGAAIGSDGRRYDLETDLRAFEGTYVAEDGSRRHGTFALI
jgi:hypothetical protein